MRLPLILTIERRRFLARLLCRGDVSRLVLRIDGRLGLVLRDGTPVEVQIDGSTSVFARLIVLRYRQDGRLRSLVLPRGALGAEAHRRLRVWLRGRAKPNRGISVDDTIDAR